MTTHSNWIHGPIVVAGNWEPLIFRRRKNDIGTDGADLYAREHSPAAVEALANAGVNLLLTHYFKGYGLEAEREDIEMAHRLIHLCHARNIKVGGYIGDTFMYETMLLEEPAAQKWAQVDAQGVRIPYGATQNFRWRWCRNNPAFFPYMQRVLKLGVENGLDLIHFDNFLNKPEPHNCRCAYCASAFRSFLEQKYAPAELKERLGFARLSQVVPPVFSAPLYAVYGNDAIQDPLFQEWVDFRCQALADSYAQLSTYCRELNPGIAIECNPTGITGENPANMRSVDHARLLPHGEFFWDETYNPHGLLANGVISTNIRSMKMGETLGNRVFHYCFRDSETDARLRMAEALAYNGGCLGMIGFLHGDTIPTAGRCEPFVRFLQKNPAYFLGTESLATVAVYRNFSSLAYNAWEPHLQAILCEQTLLHDHIPFSLIFDLESLPRTVVVPGMECLSDTETACLLAHVRGGGTVILLGRTGIFDQWRRKRPKCPFADHHCENGQPARIGEGLLIQLPALDLPADAPAKEDRQVCDDFFRVVDARFWGPSPNTRNLTSLLASSRPFTTNAARTTFIEVRRAQDDSLLVHLINYDANRLGEELEMDFPDAKWKKGTLASPFSPTSEVSFLNTDRTGFRLVNAEIYSLLVLEPDDTGSEACQ